MTDRARCAAPILALVALAGAPGCQLLTDRAESIFYTPYLEPSFERTVPLMGPENLRITSTSDRQIGLSWDPVLVGDVAGYAITRAIREDGSFAIVGQQRGRFAAVFNDPGEGPMRLGDGETYYYRIHAYDSEGRIGEGYAEVSARTDSRPSVPPSFQAYSSLPRRVALSWEPSLSSTVVGYNVYRSPSLGGEFERLSYVSGRLTTVYEDPVPGDLRVMYYKLQAVNRFGGTSDLSEPVRAVTKPEPLPPTGLSARAPSLGRVELSWQPNVEPDLDRYQIWRQLEDEGSARPVASVSADATQYSDPSLRCGERVRYQLRAIDRDGLVSAFSEPLELRALDLDLGLERTRSALLGEARGAAAGGYALRWNREHARGWPAVRLVQKRSLLPDRELGVVRSDAPPLPLPLAPGRYRIAATLTAQIPDLPAGRPAPPRPDAPTCVAELEVPAAPAP